MLREFKKQQIMRQIEKQDIDQQYEPSPSLGDEDATRSPQEQKGNLKKQSQYVPGIMNVTPFMKGGYGNISDLGIGENKANQSQSKPISSYFSAK
jgi:hypothetical protein